MGFHDYICFVQGNGQTLCNFLPAPPYDKDGVGRLCQNASSYLSLLPTDLREMILQYDQDIEYRSLAETPWFDRDPVKLRQHAKNKEEFDTEIFNSGISFGGGFAVVVKIPRDAMTTADIANLPLADFGEYEAEWLSYNFDGRKFSIDGWDTSDKAVWTSKAVPGYHLVTFQPFAYDCFVRQAHHPNQIPYSYLWTIFNNRQQDLITLFPDLDRAAIVRHLRHVGLPKDLSAAS